MRVLVLGGTGFIGCHIVRRLVESGHEVAVLGRTPKIFSPNVAMIEGDRNRLDASALAFGYFRPHIVVDAIAFTEEQAKGLLAAFSRIAIRTVVLSSGDVYRAYDIFNRKIDGALEPTPLSESSPLRERMYPYRGVPAPAADGFRWDDYEKILVERVVLAEAGLPATVLRLPMVYGPGDYTGAKRRFGPYLKRMDDGRPAILLDRETAGWHAPWGYVEDVAEAVCLAVENEDAAGQIYNVCEADTLDLQSWIERLAAVAGWRGRIVVVDQPCPPPNLPRTLNPEQNLNMDTAKIRRELGYRETVSRNEALWRTVVWDREHSPEQTDATQFDYAAEDAVLANESAGGR